MNVQDEFHVGRVVEVLMDENPQVGSPFCRRATHLNGRRAPKVVLSKDAQIPTDGPCRVRVVHVEKPKRMGHGYIEVAFHDKKSLRLDGIYIDPLMKLKLQILLESGVNILLDGPQGCGKTVLTKAVAEALGMNFVFFNCAAVVEPSDFLATLSLSQNEEGQVVTRFIKTEFLLALQNATQEIPTLIFLDEFNRCQESARNALMPALDATRRIFDPCTNTFLPIPESVLFIAAVNRGSEFSGTFAIDAAQLDRFAPLQMDYPPPAAERSLLQDRYPELAHSLIRTVVDIADALRKADALVTGLSVRATDEACIYLAHERMAGQERAMLPEILKSSFCGRLYGHWHDATTDAGIAWQIIERSL